MVRCRRAVVRAARVLRKCILSGGEGGGGRAEPEVGRAGELPRDHAAGTALTHNTLKIFPILLFNVYWTLIKPAQICWYQFTVSRFDNAKHSQVILST